jgi:hypothetical protein
MQRAFIYGSCVTRDGVDLWPDYGLEMAGYVARQSLISATAPARPGDFRTDSIASPFQKRMADGDIRGNVIAKLASDTSAYDVILWDITDERLGVYRVPSGGYVSRVVDYTTGIYQGSAPLQTPIKIGSEAHRSLWLASLDRFIAQLDEAGVTDRLVLNALPWATHDETGQPVTTASADADAFNAVLSEYAKEVENRGIRVAHTDAARAVQATTHQWGPAPFHYARDTYHASLQAITAVL